MFASGISVCAAHAILEDIRSRRIFPAAIVVDERNPFMTLVAGALKGGLGSSVASFVGVDQSAGDVQPELLGIHTKEVKSLLFLGHDPCGYRNAKGEGHRHHHTAVYTRHDREPWVSAARRSPSGGIARRTAIHTSSV